MNMQYKHPYDEIVIQDNTVYQETLATPNYGTSLLSPMISSKGEDGVIKTYVGPSTTEFLKEFGKPKFKEHGQAVYNILNWLEAGGSAHVMRVTAADATYANALVIVKIKKEEDAPVLLEGEPLYIDAEGNETTESEGNTPFVHDKVSIKIETKSISNLASKTKAEILADLEDEYTGTPDAFGFVAYPLFAVVSKGKGKYGNSLHMRVSRNTLANSESDYVNYLVEVLENESSLAVVDGPLSAALYPDAVNSYGENDFIEDVVTKNSKKVDFVLSEKYYEIITDLVNSVIDYEVEPKAVDILFGVDKDTNEDYRFVAKAFGTIDLSGLTGVALGSGSDGAFEVGAAGRDDAITTRLVDAFEGTISKDILNPKKYPASILLDANFDSDVKSAMLQCKATRGTDCFAIFDAGVISSLALAKTWRETDFTADDWTAKLYFQHAVVPDKYTLKDITVTFTYFLAKMIPSHDETYGSNRPLAGENYGKVYGYNKGSLLPTVDTEDEKEELYTRQLNYVEETEKYIVMSTDITAQKKSSDLSSGNNARVTLEMKKMLRDWVPTKRFEYMSDGDLAKFNSEASALIKENFIDTNKCARAEVIVSATPDQMRRSILQIDLGVAFNPIVKRTLSYIRINPYA